MVRRFDHCLELLARVKRYDASRGDRDFLARLGIATRSLRLLAKLEVAEAGKLHAAPFLERGSNFFEEALDHVLRFALVEAQLFEEEIGEFGFGERHREIRISGSRRTGYAARRGVRPRSARCPRRSKYVQYHA